jgi:hypothetical protein
MVEASVSRTLSRGEPSGRQSVFDIVYPTIPNGILVAASTRSLPRSRPVNFLYVGLFLRFEKLRSQCLTYA